MTRAGPSSERIVSDPLKRSLARKVRTLGVGLVVVIAVFMLFLGGFFFTKILTDSLRFKEGTSLAKRTEAEGLAKLLALELGRTDALRYARAGAPRGTPEYDAAQLVRAILWEKVTFIGELAELDLIARGPICIRPMGRDQRCQAISDLPAILARFDGIDRLEILSEGVYVVPIYVSGSFWGLLRLSISDTAVQYTLQQIAHKNQQDKVAFVFLLLFCLVAAGSALFFGLRSFFRKLHRPLIALTNRAVAFGENPDAPVAPLAADPEDEIGVLAQRFTEMQARLVETIETLARTVEQKEQAILEMKRKDEMLRAAERLASVGKLAAGVAHEISNLLNPMPFIIANLQACIEDGAPPDPAELGMMSTAITDCGSILRNLRSMAKPREATNTSVCLNEQVQKVCGMVRIQTQSRGVRIVTDLAEDMPSVWGVADELRGLVTNLIYNARDAIEAADRRGTVTVRTRKDEAGRAVLEVRDDGIGMTAEVKERIFEPFYSTKGLKTGSKSTGGTGLGLYISYGTLNRHGARVEVTTAPGEGTAFEVTFPLEQDARRAEEGAESA